MATDDIQRLVVGTAPAPAQFKIPGNGQMRPKEIFATFDGTAAASAYMPALKIISDGGKTVGIHPTDVSVAAGGSADVTWFRGLRKPCPPPSPSPNPLGTVWAWWDFSDTTTITLDGSSKISQITDKSGGGHTLAQASASHRPAETTINGLNAALCDSTNYTALIGGTWSPSLSQPYTIFCVSTQTIAASPNYFPGPYGAVGADFGPVLFENDNNVTSAILTETTAVLVAKAAPWTQTQFTAIYDGASSHLRINAGDTPGTVDNHPIISTSVGAQHFPRRLPFGEAMDGAVGEVIIYQGHLVSAQVLAVEAYLKAKWNTP